MLKQLIQRLPDSRTTPAEAGHASKPGSAVPVDYNPSASVDNWGPVLSNSTAVSDGYISATGRTTSDKGFFQINTQALQITTTGTSNPGGEILNLFTPVSKGRLFSVYGRYLEQVTVRLVKTIWGGHLRSFVSAVCKRGQLCLSRLSLCLPRSSCKANLSGSAVRHTLQGGFRSRPASLNMFRQVTASWDFISRVITLTKRLTYTPMAPAETLSLVPRFQRRQRTATQSLEQSPLRKVTLLLSAVHSLSYGSHQRWEANSNLSTGGALC